MQRQSRKSSQKLTNPSALMILVNDSVWDTWVPFLSNSLQLGPGIIHQSGWLLLIFFHTFSDVKLVFVAKVNVRFKEFTCNKVTKLLTGQRKGDILFLLFIVYFKAGCNFRNVWRPPNHQHKEHYYRSRLSKSESFSFVACFNWEFTHSGFVEIFRKHWKSDF